MVDMDLLTTTYLPHWTQQDFCLENFILKYYKQAITQKVLKIKFFWDHCDIMSFVSCGLLCSNRWKLSICGIFM